MWYKAFSRREKKLAKPIDMMGVREKIDCGYRIHCHSSAFPCTAVTGGKVPVPYLVTEHLSLNSV